MKALCWHGRNDVRIDTVPDPTILNPRDAIIKVTATAICGSDLHLYNAFIPTLMEGDILGHEFMVRSAGSPSTAFRNACRWRRSSARRSSTTSRSMSAPRSKS